MKTRLSSDMSGTEKGAISLPFIYINYIHIDRIREDLKLGDKVSVIFIFVDDAIQFYSICFFDDRSFRCYSLRHVGKLFEFPVNATYICAHSACVYLWVWGVCLCVCACQTRSHTKVYVQTIIEGAIIIFIPVCQTGEIIAFSGDRGFTPSSHLHLEVRDSSTPNSASLPFYFRTRLNTRCMENKTNILFSEKIWTVERMPKCLWKNK